MLVFLHDVHWPCARRDFYYAPERIPTEFRQPYDYEGGAVPGHSALVRGGGFRGAGQFAWAVREGGPQNGVLTEARVLSGAQPLASFDRVLEKYIAGS